MVKSHMDGVRKSGEQLIVPDNFAPPRNWVTVAIYAPRTLYRKSWRRQTSTVGWPSGARLIVCRIFAWFQLFRCFWNSKICRRQWIWRREFASIDLTWESLLTNVFSYGSVIGCWSLSQISFSNYFTCDYLRQSTTIHDWYLGKTGCVSRTFWELSKIILQKYTMPEIPFIAKISSWNSVRVPKAWLWAHGQSFNLKEVHFLEFTHFERRFWRALETLVTHLPGHPVTAVVFDGRLRQ